MSDCTWIAGETKPRSFFEWQTPPGVSIEQDYRPHLHVDRPGRRTRRRYIAVCDCGRRSGPESSRADAISELAEVHRLAVISMLVEVFERGAA